MSPLLLLTLLLPAVSCYVYDNEFKRWSLSRRSFECQSSGGKCYSTADCCTDYVCAAFDDFGMKPTMPGWCVHEKELEPCVSSMDCEEGTKCRSLGTHRYCVPEEAPPRKMGSSYSRPKGTIGSDCNDDRDCAAYDADGQTKLCCQRIRRGRQSIKQKCDPITPISMCISARR